MHKYVLISAVIIFLLACCNDFAGSHVTKPGDWRQTDAGSVFNAAG
jgi:hypothetical protein